MIKPNSFGADTNGWSWFLPQRPPVAPLTGDHHYPWVVIGAGVTGLACARRLGELHPQEEILLLDARLVGQSASGRNSGYSVAHSRFGGAYEHRNLSEYQRINRITQYGLSLLRETVNHHNIKCQWEECGFHHTAADENSLREWDNFARYLETMEVPYTCLEAEELSARLGTKLYQKGIHTHQDVLLQPAALVQGLADSLPSNVRLLEQNAVVNIVGGATPVVHLKSANIKANKVIVATNHEMAKLGVLGNRLIGTTLSGSFTRKLIKAEMANLGSLKSWGVLSLHGGGATVRLTSDRRICIRNTAEYLGAKLMTQYQLAARQKIHRNAFDRRFPQLSHVPFEHAWSCVEGVSANGTNMFGSLSGNVYYAGGFNGTGLTRGTAFGHGLAEFAGGGQSSLITDCLANPISPRLPPRPLLDIGAYFTVRNRFRGVGLDR